MRSVARQIMQNDSIAIRRPDQSLANGQVISRQDLKHFVGNDDVEIYKVNRDGSRTKRKSTRGISGARVGSFDNIRHRPGGGHTQIYHEDLDWTRTRGDPRTVIVHPDVSPRPMTRPVIYTSGGFIRRPSDDVFLKANNGHADVLKIHNIATPETGRRTAITRAGFSSTSDGRVYLQHPDNRAITTLPVLQTAEARQPVVMVQNPPIRSKVGSLDNISHKPGGGHTQIFHDDRDWNYTYNPHDKAKYYYHYDDTTPRSLTTTYDDARWSKSRLRTAAYDDARPRSRYLTTAYDDETPRSRVITTAYGPRQQTQQVVYDNNVVYTQPAYDTASEDVTYYQYPSNQRTNTARVMSQDEYNYYYPEQQVIEQYPVETVPMVTSSSRFPAVVQQHRNDDSYYLR